MVRFTKKEATFIKSRPESRVATVSEKGWPQISTVIHAFDGKYLYFATDYDTKKYSNLLKDNRIGVAIDVYDRQPRSVLVQGKAMILEEGAQFRDAYKLLERRHAYYRANPFKEGEAPIIKVLPIRKVSAGL
ncbi:MAG: pyridoxamine 5'-phosphate oxidase family protein [Candidatus Micrarchaeota archaeon]|nr:pyridoxamine 5'-phosphate oxidase family protein [Candidatus Micrarchaeota archaeon]